MLDTSILIPFRDGNTETIQLVETFGEHVFASVVSQVELEGGVFRDPAIRVIRENGLAQILRGIRVLDFTPIEARAYGQIVAQAGYSRRKLIDRMIAAQAIVANAMLVTLYPDDFADIPNLKVYSQ